MLHRGDDYYTFPVISGNLTSFLNYLWNLLFSIFFIIYKSKVLLICLQLDSKFIVINFYLFNAILVSTSEHQFISMFESVF